jgi:hypothetical protein
MFHVTLNDKKVQVPFVKARALREITPAMDVISKMEKDENYILSLEEMDVLVKWFCLFLNDEFTLQEIYDHYPADRLTYDITLAVLCVQKRVTEALKDFPTQAAMRPQEKKAEKAEA